MRVRWVQLAAAAALMLLSSAGSGLWSGLVSATYVYIYTQDFDEDWPPDFYAIEPKPLSWYVKDNNAACGLDYWGRTSYRSFGGTYSAWCAQNGYNSVNLAPNRDNHYYDQDMQSCMALYLGDIEGYEEVYLAFRYWAETGTASLNDYLEIRAFVGSAWVKLWTQPNVGNKTWELAVMSVPTSATWIGWFFFSDADVGLGPYEGVYVDDIVVAGNDISPPSSSVSPLEAYWGQELLLVQCNASDSFGSGLSHICLYYRYNGTGGFVKYAPPANPSGEWPTGLIVFNTTLVGGDGLYEFYSVATDKAGNAEPAPSVPDAYTIVDTRQPLTEASLSEEPGIHGWHSTSVHVILLASDAGSGVGETWFRVGSGDFQPYGGELLLESDGIHKVQFYSVDRAGNKEQIRTVDVRIDCHAPELNVSQPLNNTELASDDVLVSWSCTDAVSGISHFTVTIDGRLSEYCNASARELLLKDIGEGEHEIVVRAFDRANNSAEVTLVFDVPAEEEEAEEEAIGMLETALIAGVLAAIVIALALLFLMRRHGNIKREKEDQKESAGGVVGGPEEGVKEDGGDQRAGRR
ncbi:MAG: hypothetical protein QXJ32_01930 [Thermoplasmata archaeon]